MLAPAADGFLEAVVSLAPGVYDYKFRLEHGAGGAEPDAAESPTTTRWSVCPATETGLCDTHTNNRVHLGSAQSVALRLPGAAARHTAAVHTSADGWVRRHPLQRLPGGDWGGEVDLPAGRHLYRLFADGEWLAAPVNAPLCADTGHAVLHAAAPVPSVTVFYASTWLKPRLLLAGGGQAPLSQCGPGGGLWRVTLPAAAAGPALQFTVGDGGARVDAPPGGGLYACPLPGAYRLERGRLAAAPSALRPPFMLSADLDGTLVGTTAAEDAATGAFGAYWLTHAQPRATLLFNTGRSIGQVLSLLRQKAGLLPVPDAIAAAVGTQVWRLRSGHGRGPPLQSPAPGAPGEAAPEVAEPPAEAPSVWDVAAWEQDESFTQRLSAGGWVLEGAQAAAAALVEATPGDCHWLDRGTEHPHRVSLAVAAPALERSCAALAAGLQAQGCAAQLVVSGTGDWRYVDALAPAAGKRAAAEHVAAALGIPLSRVVAAGDSGNDTAMLAGSFRAIVVGNAQPDLGLWALGQSQDGRLVCAAGHGAAGVLEGLALHGLY